MWLLPTKTPLMPTQYIIFFVRAAAQHIQACWDWYTAEIKDCKTPPDALAYSMRMVDWSSDWHIYGTLRNVCLPSAHLEDMETPWLMKLHLEVQLTTL